MSPKKRKTDKPIRIPRRSTAQRPKARRVRVSPFVRVYQSAPVERIAIIRKGLPAKELLRTSQAMQLPKERVYKMLQLPVSTIRRKLAQDKRVSSDHSERILGLQRLIGQVEIMTAESGDNTRSFDAAAWFGGWLNEAVPALGNKKPGDFLDTVAGQTMISDLLAQMQSGAYA